MPRTPTATTTYYHVGKIPSLEIKNCTNPAPAACGQPKTPAKHPVYGRTQARYFGAAIQTGKKIRDIIRARGLDGPKVLIIAQGSDGRERIVLRYMRTPETRGPALYLFDVADTYFWSPRPGNPHAKVATSRELLADILAADLVWPTRLDGWTGSAIFQVVRDPRCLTNPRAFILVKRSRPKDGRDRFECIFNDYIATAG